MFFSQHNFMKKLSLFLSLIFFITFIGSAQDSDIIPGKIVLKFHAQDISLQSNRTVQESRIITEGILQEHGLISFQPFLTQNANEAVSRRLQETYSLASPDDVIGDLKRTYIVKIDHNANSRKIAERIHSLPGVAYAEPFYNYEILDLPNDPKINTPGHDYFDYHRFTEAWGVSKSSTDVVIAILDTGVLYTHEDLKNSLWRNPDPGRATSVFNEVENDTIGWNFWQSGNPFAGEEVEQNNNPIGDYSDHGTFVAGLAAADTDNGIGMAGTGYHAQYMPVKIGGTKDFPRSVPFGPQGVLYAAINGADVINCSFGGSNFSFFFEDIVKSAIEMGSIIVAAAGNSNNDVPLYPASYDHVLNVGAETRNPSTFEYDGSKANFSSYGYTVDVFAAGANVLSTTFSFDESDGSYTDSYRRSSGTSFAAPVVAGLAALLRSEFPDWSPERIVQQIRATASNIDSQNTSRRNKMGNGTIDAYRALTDLQPGLFIDDYNFKGPDNLKLNIGEQGTLTLDIFNHGQTATVNLSIQNLQGIISSDDQQTVNLPSGETTQVTFDVRASQSSFTTTLPIQRISITGNEDIENFIIFPFEDFDTDTKVSDDYTLSFMSDGNIGFRRTASRFGGGTGFLTNDDSQLLFEASLMVAAYTGEETIVLDNTRAFAERNRDFRPSRWYRVSEDGFYGSARFISTNADKFRNLEVELETFRVGDSDYKNTIWVKYTFRNKSNQPLENIFPGVFVNWDIPTFNENSVTYFPDDSLHIVSSMTEDAPFTSVVPIGNVASLMAIDNESPQRLQPAQSREDSLSFGIYYDEDQGDFDGFTTPEKLVALKAGNEQPELSGKDLSTVASSGPYRLDPDEIFITGFIISYSDSEEELLTQIKNARALQLFEVTELAEPVGTVEEITDSERPKSTELLPAYPNPFNPVTTLSYSIAEHTHAVLSVYDILGRRVATLVNEQLAPGNYNTMFDASALSSGVYQVILKTDNQTHISGITLIK